MAQPSEVLGLTSAEAARRLAEQGPNRLATQRSRPWWHRLVAELVHFFALLFWAAGILAFVAGMPQLGIAIFVVVVLNGLFAFAQEERAQHAAQRLREMLPRRATVVRDGRRVEASAEDLVVGDVMLLGEGDRISADGRIICVTAMAVDSSAMTGESIPGHPGVGESLYAGCFVLEGQAQVEVTATGRQTRLSGIAALTATQRCLPSPLRRELTRASRLIATAAMVVGTLFFAVALLVGMPAADGFLFAVGVIVAVVPEGLLPTVTLALAIGAQRMARRNALVRHLEAVQTLGSTTFICTDKTGTLTQNQMSVVEAWTGAGTTTVSGVGYQPVGVVGGDRRSVRLTRDLAIAARQCSTGRVILDCDVWRPRGDPMEAALDAFARRMAAGDPDDERAPPSQRYPFDAHRRRMSVVVDRQIITKGAPDAVLPLCHPAPGAAEATDRMTRRGLRVLAVAVRDVPPDEKLPGSAHDAERRLTLLGLVGLEDPPRPGAAATLATCRRAGVRVAMITGDHPHTAEAVARETGLASAGRAILGAELPEDMDDLGALLDRDGAVVARVDPETKLRIARALQRRGHVLAMTGDGVNDAPALREAAIGVAMGRSGTDVAREAADVVLLDDNFETIVAAVEQGRATFTNIRRFLTYHLADNVAELAPFVVWALSAGHFPLAIGVLQVLALDIGTDVFPALALGAEPPRPHVLAGPPVRGHLLDRVVMVRAFAVLGLTEAVVSMAAFIATFVADGWRPGSALPTGSVLWTASGAAFTAIVLGQCANAFACRSTEQPAWAIPIRTNPLLVAAVAVEIALLLVLLYVPMAARLLTHAGPSVAGFVVASLAVPAVLLADALAKRNNTTSGNAGVLAGDLRP